MFNSKKSKSIDAKKMSEKPSAYHIKQSKDQSANKKNEKEQISCVASIGSCTDSSIEEINKIILSSDNQLYYEDDLKYPLWYKKQLRLPNIPRFSPSVISLSIHRTPQGDFGIILRKGIQIERYTTRDGTILESKYQTNFTEPANMTKEIKLLPGDRLLKINDTDIIPMSREDIINHIKSCQSEINISIIPSPECLELSFRRFSNLSLKFINVRQWVMEKQTFSGLYNSLYNRILNEFDTLKYDDLIQIDKENNMHDDNNKIWIEFNEGFAGGKIVKDLKNGKYLVKLEDTDSEIEVFEEDINKANIQAYCIEESLIQLPHINHSAVLYNIRQRYCTNLIHTYVGRNLLIINPLENFNCYSEKIIHLFKNAEFEDLPPHVYSIAQTALQNMKNKHEDQNIFILGRSGSGKSKTLQNLINYFTKISNNSPNIAVQNDKIKAMWMVLDLFSNTRTGINTNASRCGKLVTLNYSAINHNLLLTGLNVQLFLFDKYRVVKRPDREPTFHIFYNFIAGLSEAEKNLYHLKYSNENNNFMTPLQRDSEKQTASDLWKMLCKATKILSISDEEWDIVCRILSAIYHLGMTDVPNNFINQDKQFDFSNKEAAKFAAQTLGCTIDDLNRAIFEFYKGNYAQIGEKNGVQYSYRDVLHGFVAGLYSDLIEMIVYFINRSLNALTKHPSQIITIIDPPGLQIPTSYDKNFIENYQDMIYNYAYEKFIYLNAQESIEKPKQQYKMNDIITDSFSDINVDKTLIDLLDNTLSSSKSCGLLNILDKEALIGNKTSWIEALERFSETHIGENSYFKFQPTDGKLIISHCNKSHLVTYYVKDWLEMCLEIPTISSSQLLLSMCSNDKMQELLSSMSLNQYSVANMYPRKSLLEQSKIEIDSILKRFTKNSNTNFIYCISPIPNAGLSQLKESVNQNVFVENIVRGSLFSVPLVKIQLESFCIFSQLKMLKLGFPEVISFKDFISLANIVKDKENLDTFEINDENIIAVLKELKISPSKYRIGKDEIFFRLGTIFNLKNNKEMSNISFIVKFQAYCRRYLAMKKLENLKIQNDAVRVLQRNCLVYLRLKSFSWWKLYNNIKPIVLLNRQERELQLEDELLKQYEELKISYQALKDENIQCQNHIQKMKNDQSNSKNLIDDLSSKLEEQNINEALLNKSIDKYKDKIMKYKKEINVLKENDPNISQTNNQDQTFIDISVEEILRKSNEQRERLEVDLVKSRKICDTLKCEINEYKYQLDSSDLNDSVEEKVKMYDNEICKLKDEAAEHQMQCEVLKRERNKLLGDVHVLEDKLAESEFKTSEINSMYQSIVNTENFDETDYSSRIQKTRLEQKIRELEEEIDIASDNLDIAEQEKIKLKLQIEKINRQKTLEVSDKEEEMELLKLSYNRKMNDLENQIEEDRVKYQSMIREKRDVENEMSELREEIEELKNSNSMERKYRKDLKNALEKLAEAEYIIEQMKQLKDDKSEIKDLKNKMDELEHSRELAIKDKLKAERDIEDAQMELETFKRSRNEMENKMKLLKSQNESLQNVNDDFENQVDELNRKLKNNQQQNIELMNINSGLSEKNEALEKDKSNMLKKINELQQSVSLNNTNNFDKAEVIRLKNKVSELEMKWSSEESSKTRLSAFNDKLKEQIFEMQNDKESIQNIADIEKEKNRKLAKQIKDLKDTNEELLRSISNSKKQYQSLSDKFNDIEEEVSQKSRELSSANQKIRALEHVLNEEDDSNDSFNDVISQVDELIKKRKFSVDQSIIIPKPDNSLRRNSIAVERLSSKFLESNTDFDNQF